MLFIFLFFNLYGIINHIILFGVFCIKKKNNGLKAMLITWGVLLIGYLLTYLFNFHLEVNNYTVKTDKINKKVRVALLTDLHNSRFGTGQKTLMKKIREQKPDIVLLGGDFAEDYVGNRNAFKLVRLLSKEYPCYYVAGNHEYRSENHGAIKQKMRQSGAVVLEGEGVPVEINGEIINICGVDDYYIGKYNFINEISDAVSDIDQNYFTILLSHRPEPEDIYSQYDFDLILSGHAHGGQWRIPFILENGLMTPDVKLFPDYTTGERIFGNTTQIVSRGLSKFTPPFPRIFNSPEIVIIDIK